MVLSQDILEDSLIVNPLQAQAIRQYFYIISSDESELSSAQIQLELARAGGFSARLGSARLVGFLSQLVF